MKKEWHFFERCAKEGAEILKNNKPVEDLTAVELEKLLLMHQIPKSKMGNKNDKIEKWKRIVESKKLPPSFKIWCSDDESKLNDLQKMEINLDDTALSQKATIKKIKMKASTNSMNVKELNNIEEKICDAKRVKMVKLEEVGVVESNSVDVTNTNKTEGAETAM